MDYNNQSFVPVLSILYGFQGNLFQATALFSSAKNYIDLPQPTFTKSEIYKGPDAPPAVV